MDPATLIGIVLGLVGHHGGMVLEGGSPATLLSSPAAFLIIIGGTFGAALASASMKDMGGIIKSGVIALKGGKKVDTAATVEELVGYADTARREGLLALEEKVKAIEDPFLKRGLEQVIDGSDPESVEEALYADLDAMKERHKVGAKFFSDLGGFAPTMGVIGTVMGLLHVLENLSDPGKLGPLIGSAFLATFWGVMLANVVFLPISNKLKRASTLEVAYKELVIQGVLSIQSGASPRSLNERLLAYLPPKAREGGGKSKAKKAA